METIVSAAQRIAVPDEMRNERWNGTRMYPDYIYVSCESRPVDTLAGRHHTNLHILSALGISVKDMNNQGFMTSTGRWVDREEGCKIARAAGQIRHKTGPDNILFSEDMW